MTLLNSKYLFINTCRMFIRQVLTAQFPAEQDLTEASRVTTRRGKKGQTSTIHCISASQTNFYHKGTSISVHGSLTKLKDDC